MKDTLELPEEISTEESPNYDACTESSLFNIRLCMKMNEELRPVVKGALDHEYIDKYIRFSKNMEILLVAVEEAVKDFDAILNVRSHAKSKNTCIS